MSKSKHNYTQYSKKNDEVQEAVEVTETPVTPVEDTVTEAQVVIPEVVQETVETVTLPEVVTGTVVGCAKLNVRAKPVAGSEVLCVLDVASELVVNVEKSNKNWFAVTTATGVEGYCMRQFINATL